MTAYPSTLYTEESKALSKCLGNSVPPSPLIVKMVREGKLGHLKE
jgi:hypothetical protein